MNKNKLYLMDGMFIAFRAYYAMLQTNLKNKNNEPIGAIFGFVSILTTILDKLQPNNIAVCFDCREKTFRHNLYPNYKANRAIFPEELGKQLPYIKQFLDLIGVNRIELPGYEADDIIGTYCKECKTYCKENGSNDWEVYCWTIDKDFYQLLAENIYIIRNKKQNDKENRNDDFDIIGVDDVKKLFGVEANEVIDYLSLIGDVADNIPGVKGIGEKSAIPLIEKYKTIENIYANISQIDKPRIKQLLIDGKENAVLSKQLVTINNDVPLPNKFNYLKRKEIDYDGLDNLFFNLGMHQHRVKWRAINKKDNIARQENNVLF